MKQILSLTAFVFPSAVVLWCGSCSHHCYHSLVRYIGSDFTYSGQIFGLWWLL